MPCRISGAMNQRSIGCKCLGWVFFLAATGISALAEIRLPAIFSDHLVLQADHPVAVWGWAAPGVQVRVEFADRSGVVRSRATRISDQSGRWQCRLSAMVSGMSGSLRLVSSDGSAKSIDDAVVGEVWLGSGQSNMSYEVKGYNAPDEIVVRARAEAARLRPAIRYFMVELNSAAEPRENVSGHWVVASPENVGSCSSLGWNFGVALHRELHQPIGIVVSAYGGTPVEAWLSHQDLDATLAGPAIWRRHGDALSRFHPDQQVAFKAAYAAWSVANPGPLRDTHASTRPSEPYAPDNRNVPVRLYNGMIRGIEPYTVRGVLWFQGDNNQGHPEEYPELIHTLVRSWRRNWGEELPFYYVELNNMGKVQEKPVESWLTLIREAQNAMLELPRTGVVTAIDLGLPQTSHFPDKGPVGRRLANLILSEIYHRPMGEVHSPEFAGYAVDGRQIRLRFRHAGGLRTRRVGGVSGFAIRGRDNDWAWATAKIEGEEILVWNDQIPKPVAVRYGWAANPVITVENRAGLPLRPFRTDRD